LRSTAAVICGAIWWRCARRQALPRAQQPTLFELHEDHRPPGERNAAERYCEPSLFTLMERIASPTAQ
jgi:hypothetical protein